MTIATQVIKPVRQGPHAPHEPLPLWRESLWPVEWITLRMSPVYYGAGVPAGDGSPVVVVPGFLCPDAFMYELYAWLGRIGYRPYVSGIGMNVSCPAVTVERLTATVQRVKRDTGRRVRIVGHSLGGIIGRQVCIERPELVAQLVTLGTPIGKVHAHPAILAAAEMLGNARSLTRGDRCLTAGCRCESIVESKEPVPKSVHHAAIYTRGDGVVDWHDARERDPRLNHEVGGTHIGLVYNPRAYKALGQLLAEVNA